MCIDTVGGWYLERLHNYGRAVGTADYLHFMKAAKFKKKKKEIMQQHYSTLVSGAICALNRIIKRNL